MVIDDIQAQALLRRIAAGDEQAMAEFFQAFERNVYAFVLRRLGSESEAEDVVVETMYEIWKSAGRFRGESQVRTWLLGIARFKLLSKLRARDDSEHVDIADVVEILPADDEGGFERLANQQRTEHVGRCLERLPAEQREALHLFFYEDLSILEIAGVQQIPDNTVKTRLFHGRQKIRRCLENMLRAEEGTS